MSLQVTLPRDPARRLRSAQRRYEQSAEETKRARAELDRAIIELVEAGHPQVDVARALGVTKARVNFIVQRKR